MKATHKTAAEELYHGDKNIREAAYTLDGGFLDMTARMLYYALFHFEKALLHYRGNYTESHKQTHIQFRGTFVKSGEVAADGSELIRILQTQREQADYGYFTSLTHEELTGYLEQVREFGARVSRLIADGEDVSPPPIDPT